VPPTLILATPSERRVAASGTGSVSPATTFTGAPIAAVSLPICSAALTPGTKMQSAPAARHLSARRTVSAKASGRLHVSPHARFAIKMKSVRPFLAGIATNLAFLTILLVSAGRLNYWPAWLYVAIGIAMIVLMQSILRADPNLVKERARPGPGAKAWDKNLLGLGFVLTLATLVIAGLDAGRYHWSPRLTWPWLLAGLLLNVVGVGIFLIALRENRFFSAVVRIQSDRGQTVCRSGPYRVIRHPGNAGMIIGTMGLPLLLMSAWSAIPALLSVLVLIARTRREDTVLENELDGYRAYQSATPYRLVPGLW
jgi:protein-S-isoprenylcysteine O-methyltransferase Ste14